MNLWWLLVGGSYLFGSFPTAHLVGWIIGRNPSKEGSGNPGATNVFRLAGYKPAIIVLVGDVLKGVVPSLVAFYLTERNIAVACGAAAIVGHIFSIFRKFKGGKGVATYGGMLLALNPFVGLASISIWGLVFWASRMSSLAGLIASSLSILWIALGDRELWETTTAAGIVVLIIIRHFKNIKRMFRGEERSMGSND